MERNELKEKVEEYVEMARKTNSFGGICKELGVGYNTIDFFKIRGAAEVLGLVEEGYSFGPKKRIIVTDKGEKLVEEDMELDFSSILK